MKKWEYKVIKVEKKGEKNSFGDYIKGTTYFIFKDIARNFTYDIGTNSVQVLNELGAEGWELVDTTEFTEGLTIGVNNGGAGWNYTSAVNYNFKREVEVNR
jgi:hypothetical protein